MTEVVGREGGPAAQVVIGVDTHQDQHVAVAIDRHGVRLAECHAAATTCGYGELERWSLSLGEIRAFGIEGTGSYGAGLARFLTARGYTVVEVNLPDRSTRYRKGKSDPTGAEMAARAVQAGIGQPHTVPAFGLLATYYDVLRRQVVILRQAPKSCRLPWIAPSCVRLGSNAIARAASVPLQPPVDIQAGVLAGAQHDLPRRPGILQCIVMPEGDAQVACYPG